MQECIADQITLWKVSSVQHAFLQMVWQRFAP
jgi:hypothetical protein